MMSICRIIISETDFLSRGNDEFLVVHGRPPDNSLESEFHYSNKLAIRGGDAKNILEYIRIYIIITANIIAIAVHVSDYRLFEHPALLPSYSVTISRSASSPIAILLCYSLDLHLPLL